MSNRPLERTIRFALCYERRTRAVKVILLNHHVLGTIKVFQDEIYSG